MSLPIHRLSLTWRFALAALVVIAVLGYALMRVLSATIIDSALANARAEAHDTVARRLLQQLSPSDLAAPLAGQRLREFDRFVQASIISDRTARLKIWDRTGRIIYADDPTQVGQVFPIEDELAVALAGKTASELSHGTKAENRDEVQYGTLLEVYTPITFPDSPAVAGAFEVYQVYAPLAEQIARLQRDVLVSLGGGLALLYLVLLGIVHGGTRTIQRQHRDLERAFTILETTTDFVGMTTVDGRILYLNRAARQMLGVPVDEPIAHLRLAQSAPPWARDRLLSEALPTALRDGVWSGETVLQHREGHELPVSQVILAHRSRRGTEAFLSTIARDISDRKRFEAQLVHLASYDALTDLYNRRRFEAEVGRILAHARRFGTEGALLFLDLDGFKGINDSLGHRVGDELLANIAAQLRTAVGETDILARVGGDEFAVLLAQTDAAAATALADQLRAALQHSVVLGDQRVRCTASIGVALFPTHGTTADALLVCADLAMYQAKELRDAVYVYRPEQELQAELTGRRVWEQRLREALDQDRFVLYAQPIQQLHNGRTQYELLLRLVGADGELILPTAFLGVAERSGLIHAIDRWVVRQAIHLIAAQRHVGRELCLEVNLSGKAFADRELLPLIERELAATGIDPANLVLEITETAAIADINRAQQFLTTLKRVGCRFALDDFEVGFSSFYYLKHLPVDYIKLDGSFIQNLPHDAQDQHLVKAMVEVARGLGKQTIAEFVGDAATVELLRAYGVDYAQGFHIGRPGPLTEVGATVATAPTSGGRRAPERRPPQAAA